MQPVADNYVGHYVRAVYDFQSSEKGEIMLIKGDVFCVTSAIDNNWLYGKVRKQEGTFPCSFVEKVSLPAVQEDEKVYASIESFPAQQEGDLEFQKGELILGMWKIDENWWHGKLGSKEGMFPLTHVTELEIPKLLPQRSNSSHSKEVLYARALCDSVAQLDEELGFQAGDIISVTDVIDADWYVGELSGKQGMFLSSCVELLNEEKSPLPRSTYGTVAETSKDDVLMNKNAESFATNEASLHAGFDPTVMSYTSENTKSHDSSVMPYARTIYSFVGEMSNELSFNANDIVTLVQHVDDHWIQGELDGKIGIFPSNYVEIIVDCPCIGKIEHTNPLDSTRSIKQEYDDVGTSLEQSSCCTGDISKSFTMEQYGLVRHSFSAQTKADLNLQEGDKVTILKQIDDNWFKARDKDGNVGICPVDFVELIAVKPDSFQTDCLEITNNESSSKLQSLFNEARENGLDESSYDTEKNLESKDCDITVNVAPLRSATSSPLPQESNSVDIRKPAIKPYPKPLIKLKPAEVEQNKVPPPIPDKNFTPKLPNVTINVKEPSEPGECIDSISCHDSTHSPSAESMASEHEASSLSELANDSKSVYQPSNQKAFSNNDFDKPLDSSIVQDEHDRSKLPSLDIEIENNHSSLPITNKMKKGDNFKKQNAWENVHYKSCNDNVKINCSWTGASSSVEIDNTNSKLFTGVELDISEQAKPLQMRKPPPIPKKTDNKELSFERKLSLLKTVPLMAATSSKVPLTSVKPVPQRPAPSPPTESTHLPVKLPGSKSAIPHCHSQKSIVKSEPDISSKSDIPPKSDVPPKSSSAFYVNEIDAIDDDDTPPVTDLKKRIMDMEKDLDNCRKSRQELEQTLPTVELDEKEQVEESIEFYDANINGLSEELISLKDNLIEIRFEEQEDAKRKADEARKIEKEKMEKELRKRHKERRLKNKEKRENVIREIIQTEKEFLFSLQFGFTTFLESDADGDQPPDVDVETMFGNMDEITDVSQRLLTKLDKAVEAKGFGQQVIGPCFLQLAEDMKNSYAPYCRNHDEVITLLMKYDSIMEIKDYFERMLNKLREKLTLFDLGALLIKPVQRILKYPLLLNELMKVTEEDHCDKNFLQQAVTKMTDVANAINEYKRRKDLVYKYKKESETKFGDKLAKLSLHSIRKKSGRLRERLSNNLGIALQTKDEAYNKEETQFRSLEKMVKIYISNVNACLEQMQETVLAQENFAQDLEDFYCDISCHEVHKYVEVNRQIADKFFIQFHEQIAEQVLSPLGKLMQTFDGPMNVMEKRSDKLLDYNILLRKARDADKMQDKSLQTAKVIYEALNTQLLDELPQLYRLSLQLLQDCITSFIFARKQYVHNILQHMTPLLDLPLLLSSWENVIEVFNCDHVCATDRLSVISFIPKGFNPCLEAKQMDKSDASLASPQSDIQITYLKQQYLPGRLYHVTQDCTAVEALDLPVFCTDIVGLIKQQDPMGNKKRWFVDNGARKGFIPRRVLTLYKSSPSHDTDDALCDLPPIDGDTETAYDSQTLTSDNSQQSVYDVPSSDVCHIAQISNQDTSLAVYCTPYMHKNKQDSMTEPAPSAKVAASPHYPSVNELDIADPVEDDSTL